jgi:hypothetical protein
MATTMIDDGGSVVPKKNFSVPSVPLCLCGEYDRASNPERGLSQETTLCRASDAGIHHGDTEAQSGTEN